MKPTSVSWLIAAIIEPSAPEAIADNAGSTQPEHIKMIPAHTSICVTATKPTPIILPIISHVGLTEVTTSSNTRLFFSSMMEFITMLPYSMMNIYRMNVAIKPMA